MKKALLFCLIPAAAIIISSNAYSQCTPDPGCTPAQLICPSALSPGCQGGAYAQTITLSLGATIGGLPLNSITINNLSNLPPGLSFSCSPANCLFVANSSGCVLISGTPSAAGTYTVRANLSVSLGLGTVPIDTAIGNIVITATDCAGVCGGTASIDNCGICSGGTTGILPNCDDGDACATDACDGSGGCINTPLNCDDNDACNGIETCDPSSGCVAGTPLNCDDADSCTTDECASGICFHTAIAGCGTPCVTPVLSFTSADACVGDSAQITNNSTDIDPAAIYSVDGNGDGIIDATFPAAAFPAGASQYVQVNANMTLTFIAENPGGCTDTFVITIAAITCDDGDLCTADICANATCSSTPVNCDDNDACTTDGCDPLTGCTTAPLNCDDGDSCTVDVCVNGICSHTSACCVTNADCDDSNACTTDACNAGACSNTPLDCDDGYSCTQDICNNGVCEHTAICCTVDADCDDAQSCTVDECINGTCSRTQLNCDDNDACTVDSCGNTQCFNTPINCDDNDPCTTDACNNGQCSNTAISCDDGDDCTTDVCDASGTCISTAINCDDGDACTADVCVGGVCFHTITCCTVSSDCEDNDLCTTDTCNSGTCAYVPLDCDDNYSCTQDFCVNGACQHLAICCQVNADCDDADGCTLDECINGICSRTPGCDDNDLCTTDACNSGQCVYTPLDCDDGNACTNDLCNNGVCGHTVLCCVVNADCADNNLCTADSCNSGTCLNAAINCDDSDSCTLDRCENGVCINEGSCCISTADCYDNDLCTVDTCMNGICSSQPRCDDGDPCTDDYCRVNYYHNDGDHDHENHNCHNDYDDDGWYDDDDDGGFQVSCYHKPKDCREGDYCTADYCDNGNCLHIPINCDDADSCTTDVCVNGYCKHAQVCCLKDIDCYDGDVCTIDACVSGVCSITPKDCNDGDACTEDICDRHTTHQYSGGRCKHRTIDCRDGNVCTTDYCDSTGACISTAVPGCCASSADCDDGDACTTDYCYHSNCKYYPVAGVSIIRISDFCQGNGTVTLKAKSTTAVSYQWSTGDTTVTIPGEADSTYSVTATDANGCTSTASYTVAGSQSLLSSYVIIAEDDIKLYQNTVFEGGVGATGSNGDIWLKNGTMVTAAGTFTRADEIHVSGGSAATVQVTTPANVTLPAFETNPYPSGANVSVPSGSTLTLTGSIYDYISIGSNSTVTFTQPDLYIEKLYTKSNVTLQFVECTKIRIKNKLVLGSSNTFNPDGFDVIVFVEDYVEINAGSTVTADIYVRDGNLNVRSSTASAPTVMKGLFIANDVEAKNNTHWYINSNCNNSCPNATQPLVVMKNDGSEDAGNELSGDTNMPVSNGVTLKAYPNPFTEKLNIEFTLPEDSRASLEIYNISGQRVGVLFEGDVKASQLQKVEFAPADASEGMLIYRLQTGSGIFYGKAMMAR